MKVNLADVGIEKIGISNVISTAQLNDISLFRSSAGHDASDDFESCRSMKHYLDGNAPQQIVETLKSYQNQQCLI